MNFVLSQDLDWREEFRNWAAPFLEGLSHAAQRQWAPLYMEGLILPGERKSMAPIAERVAPMDRQQLHNFIADSPWDTLPLEAELVKKANLLVGGTSSCLVVDDVSLVKKGTHSVGVARQCCVGVRAPRASWRRSSSPCGCGPPTASPTATTSALRARRSG